MSKFDKYYKDILEKDEHKKSISYKKLSQKMKKAIDEIFKIMPYFLLIMYLEINLEHMNAPVKPTFSS